MNELYNKIINLVNNQDEEVKTENANKTAHLFSTQRDLIAGVVAQEIAHEVLLPKHLSQAHKEGRIHIHDLQYFPLQGQTNCCLLDIKSMLETGFRINDIYIETPKSIHTAMTLATQILMSVGSSEYGGVSFDRFDETMGVYVLKSFNKLLSKAEEYNIPNKIEYAKKEIRKQTYDACQCLIYQLNSLTCTSGQSVFISIGFGLGLSWEERLVQEMLLQVQLDGIGAEKLTPVFPKLIFTHKDGVNLHKADPNYDIKQLAVKCAAKRIYPDIVNYDKVVEVTGGFKASMSCRSFLSYCEDENGKEFYSGRCNLGVVTLNTPHLALMANKNIDKFYEILDEHLELAREVCEYRLEVLAKTKAKSAPILFMEGGLLRLQAEDYVLPHLIKRGASISIGYIGLMETVNALLGNETHIYDDKSKQELALSILKRIDDCVRRFKDESGVGYSTYATPSESQCRRFRDTTYKLFGEVDGVTDREYFTNSFHLDPRKQTDPYSRMDYEAQYIPFSSGGFISYGEFPDMTRNLEALEDVWTYSYYVTPYYGANCPSDKCLECGYEGMLLNKSKGNECPKCGNTDQETLYAVRRVSGYLSSPTKRPFNKGKMTEVKERVVNNM